MKKKDSRIDTSGPGELTHNPFAALSGRLGSEAPRADGQGADGEGAPESAAEDVREPAAAPRVVVRRERKGRGGRTVTIAAWSHGSGPDGDALEGLARDLGRRLGCGARVEDGAVVLQGALVDRLAALLEKEHGARVTRGTD
ncbi:MAG: translation initiation factor [Planctomycetota bacterium]